MKPHQAVPCAALLALAVLRVPVIAQQAITMPKTEAMLEQASTLSGFDPKDALRKAKTVFIRSKTAFLDVDMFDQALMRQEDWTKLKLVMVRDAKAADLLIELDRPQLTYAHTFVILDTKTSVVLGSGKVAPLHGFVAPTPTDLAKRIIKILSEARRPVATP